MTIFAYISNWAFMNNDKYSKELFERRLKQHVENTVGFKMCTPKDYEALAESIFRETGSLLSPTTLKRLWGYLHDTKKQTPRIATLNILSRYIGYIDYETFCNLQNIGDECSSDFLTNKCLQTKSLLKGKKIKLFWKPDRCVTIQYIGLSMFKVLKSQNSKLSQNDIFICERIVENQPLLLSNLIHDNGDPTNYICGKIDGVKYQLVEE